MNFSAGCAHQCLLNWFGRICRLLQLVLKTFQENVTAALVVLKYGVQLPLTVLDSVAALLLHRLEWVVDRGKTQIKRWLQLQKTLQPY